MDIRQYVVERIQNLKNRMEHTIMSESGKFAVNCTIKELQDVLDFIDIQRSQSNGNKSEGEK